MKTAVSIPDEVFQQAEQLAKRTKRSRSRIFSDALREYVARHSPDEVTEAINRACAQLKTQDEDRFAILAGRRTLERSEW
ncbi:MAG TPA: ribbon-helix-helix protein, CopG family [Candidatus Eisenbacteria bacterium]|nr:ribbon-helix-helix protein, CopG family [Candidatus Eisenbacteria bacterium]